MKLKILVDSVSLLSPLTGIGRYTYEVSHHLKTKDELELSYFYGYYSKKLLDKHINRNRVKVLTSFVSKSTVLKKILRKLMLITASCYSPKYDLYWQPSFLPNDAIKAKKVVTTVHDFSFIIHEKFHPKERIAHFKRYFFKNILKSDMIITGSEYSKREIQERLNFEEDKIRVIYHGIDHDVFKLYKDTTLSFEVPEKFILSVGSIEPRKNLLGLLNAYDLLDDEMKTEHKLVLVGFKGWENSEIMDIVNANIKNIYYLGFISDEELAKVYNRASCFVFPSFYEGFGLPPLEAMACGTPVISSNMTSMPEICADAALYFDPYDVNHITDKIKEILLDKGLQNELTKKGLKRANEFSWSKSANEHFKLFEEVMSK